MFIVTDGEGYAYHAPGGTHVADTLAEAKEIMAEVCNDNDERPASSWGFHIYKMESVRPCRGCDGLLGDRAGICRTCLGSGYED